MSLPVYQNILNCLDDIITLDGCNDVVPTSGFRMGDIGITLNELNQYINKEYSSGSALFETKKTFSINLIANQIHQHLQSKYRATTLVNGNRSGFLLDNLQLQSGTGASWVGQEINIKNTGSFLELFISELSLITDYSGEIELRIYDLKTGKILKSESGDDYVWLVTGIAGEEVTVYPQIKIQSAKKELDIAIVYNATGINPYKVSIISQGCMGCSPCNTTQYSKIWGVSLPAGNMLKGNVSYQSYTGGMSIVYSINCNQNKWLCSMSNLIALPLLYKIGSELMDYALLSHQINPSTFAQERGEQIQKRKDEYEFKYREALDNVLKNINLPNDPVCFYCNKSLSYATMIP